MDLTNIFTIKNLCKKYGLHPNRKNGQNFLIDKNVLEKVVATAELKPNDTVLEIGPGFGVLTQELVKHVGCVVAVEKDKRLAEYLSKGLKEYRNKAVEKIKIINDDILKIFNFQFPISNPPSGGQNSKTCPELDSEFQIPNFKIVSNLPYQITSPILWKFLHEDPLVQKISRSFELSPLLRGRQARPESMVLMVQKEVGERICAKPGKMSILSVMCQFYAECKIVGLVSRNCFWPRPDVESAIVKLQINNHPPKSATGSFWPPPLKGGGNNKEFMRLVKIGFSARRKMLKNNLANGLQMPMEKVVTALKNVGLNEKIRAQELGVEEWVKIYSLLTTPLA